MRTPSAEPRPTGSLTGVIIIQWLAWRFGAGKLLHIAGLESREPLVLAERFVIVPEQPRGRGYRLASKSQSISEIPVERVLGQSTGRFQFPFPQLARGYSHSRAAIRRCRPRPACSFAPA